MLRQVIKQRPPEVTRHDLIKRKPQPEQDHHDVMSNSIYLMAFQGHQGGLIPSQMTLTDAMSPVPSSLEKP